ncbi:MAG: HAD family phosphatase [Bacteroidales bacterium]|nr:HAD family phosphatase [Bacteroidales bacterium]
MEIKNIIFDLGAVILNIDYNGPAKVLNSMGITDFEKVYSKAKQDELFDNFEKGIIQPDEFRKEFVRNIGVDLNYSEIDKIWNAIILDFPKERIKLLLELKKTYNTYLLSNTNSIHYDFYTHDLFQSHGLTWDMLLHKSYFSFEMNMRKPSLEIFEKVIENSHLTPNETLFIDDLKDNIDAAKSCGLNTIWLKEKMELTDVFFFDSSTESYKVRNLS